MTIPKFQSEITNLKRKREVFGLTDDPDWDRNDFERVHKPNRDLLSVELKKAVNEHKLTEEQKKLIQIIPKFKSNKGNELQTFTKKKPSLKMVQAAKKHGFVLDEETW